MTKKRFLLMISVLVLCFASAVASVTANSGSGIFVAKYRGMDALLDTVEGDTGHAITEGAPADNTSIFYPDFNYGGLSSAEIKRRYYEARFKGRLSLGDLSDPQLLFPAEHEIKSVTDFEYGQNRDRIFLSVPGETLKNKLVAVEFSNKSVKKFWPKEGAIFDGGHQVQMYLIESFEVQGIDYVIASFELFAEKGDNVLLVNVSSGESLKLRGFINVSSVDPATRSFTYNTSYQSPRCLYLQSRNLPLTDSDCPSATSAVLP